MMYNYNWSGMMGGAWWGMLMVPLLIWSLLWKGWALWLAARKGQKIWFVALLVINTMGILEIVYIFLFSGEKFGQKKMETPKTPPTPPVTP
ncbi:MAG: DUF5652 family protein [Candidatus Magasanikbacteria bacterium]|nr:DUF5652 family protein [Candidatus Magasanikbacteria bacterium]